MADAEEKHFTRKQAAAYLTSIGCRIAATTLAKLAANDNAGKGPRFKRWRWRTVSYTKTDLDQWAAQEGTTIE